MCERVPWNGLSEDIHNGQSHVTECAYGGPACPPGEDCDMYGAGGCAIWNHGGKSGETALPVGAAHSKSVGVGAEHYEICPKRSGHECAVHAGIWSIGSCGYIYNDIFGIADVYMADNGSTGGIAAGWNICDAQTYVPQG